MNNPLLQIENLTCRFDDFIAVNDISFSLQESEAFVLLGESGCGKTSILRAIAGLLTPSFGTIRHRRACFFDSKHNLPGYKRKVGFIFQDYAVFPHLNVRDNILFAVKERKKQTLQDMLDLFQLKGQENKMPHQLSGGQLQRVSIARSLAAETDLTLLDEPFSNLDAQLSRSLCKEIRNIFKQKGITSILVTHNPEEAFCYADRLAIMKEGKLLQVDTPENIYMRPNTLEVASLFGHCQLIEGYAKGLSAQCCLGTVPLINSCNCRVKLLLRPDNLITSPCPRGLFEIRDVRFLGEKKELKASSGQLELFISTLAGEKLSKGDRVNLSTKVAVPAFEF